jgi:hypothetical protein
VKERAEVKGNLYAKKMIFWSLLIIVSCGFCLGESDGECMEQFILTCFYYSFDRYIRAEIHAKF